MEGIPGNIEYEIGVFNGRGKMILRFTYPNTSPFGARSWPERDREREEEDVRQLIAKITDVFNVRYPVTDNSHIANDRYRRTFMFIKLTDVQQDPRRQAAIYVNPAKINFMQRTETNYGENITVIDMVDSREEVTETPEQIIELIREQAMVEMRNPPMDFGDNAPVGVEIRP